MRRASRGPVLLCLLLLAARAAQAQPVAVDEVARAERLFAEAVELRKAGDWQAACERFRASEEAAPAAGTLLNIALCLEREGDIVGAYLAYQEVARRAVARGDDERRGVAEAEVARLTERVAHLSLVHARPGQARRARVELDGAEAPTDPAGTVVVTPGSYQLTVTMPRGARWQTTVEAVAGERRDVRIPALDVGAPVEPVATGRPLPQSPAGTPPVADPATGWGGQRWAGAAVGIAGGAALGIGAYLGVRARGSWDDARAAGCTDDAECPDDRGVGLVLDARRDARRANIAFGVGAAAIAGGAILWLTGGSEDHGDRPEVTVSPFGGGALVFVTGVL